jgi:hypothetical protein
MSSIFMVGKQAMHEASESVIVKSLPKMAVRMQLIVLARRQIQSRH